MTNEEIIRGAYAAGKRRITCPACNGGDSSEQDTMSLWIGAFGDLCAKCMRATCGAWVLCDGTAMPADAKPAFEPKPLLAPYRLVTSADHWGKEWLNRMYAPDFFPDVSKAHIAGLRVLSNNPEIAVWRLRALDGALIGHITRTPGKKILTYKDLDRALYYWNGVVAHMQAMFMFEDAMSAALCPRPAVALLGTSIPQGLVDDLKRQYVRSVLVCLDPGAEDAGAKVYEKLVAAGVPATFVPMAKDYKDMTLDERKILEETYA